MTVLQKISLLILFIALAFSAHAQQDPLYSQYMFNQMNYNAGAAGSKEMVCITALNRVQWLGMKGAPTSQAFTADAPFNIFNKTIGIGFSGSRDVIGFQTDYGFRLSLAPRWNTKIGDGKCGFGVSFGVYNSSFKPSFSSKEAALENDLPATGKSTVFDLGTGFFYNTEKIYMGLSVTHLIESAYDFKNQGNVSSGFSPWLVRQYYLTAGYKYTLPNPMLELVPSFYIQSDGRTSVINLNTNLVYNNRFWGGLSYRVGAAFTGLIGFEFLTGVRFTYSYDYETSDLNKFSTGSHEVSVVYCFKLKKEKIPQKYKSIRFL